MARAREWQIQDAKNRLSEVVRLAQSAPQTVTVHGRPTAVIVSFDEYQTLSQPRKSLLDVVKTAPKGFGELDIERSSDANMREAQL